MKNSLESAGTKFGSCLSKKNLVALKIQAGQLLALYGRVSIL